jgi:hypothetical protein
MLLAGYGMTDESHLIHSFLDCSSASEITALQKFVHQSGSVSVSIFQQF